MTGVSNKRAEAGHVSASDTIVLRFGRRAKEYDITRIREVALSAIHQSVIIADAEHDDCPIIYANEAFERLTGYKQSEILGKNCRFLSGRDTSKVTQAAIRKALADREPFEGRLLNYRKDGSAFWNELSISPIEEQGLGRFFIGVQVDVTERLELEARLREAQRMEAVGKLSGGIAHDFNNMLALIMGNAEIIAEDALAGSSVQEAAKDIMDAAHGGSNLVARMLQYARGETGLREEVAVNNAIEDVIALLNRTLDEKVRFETDLSAAIGKVQVDRTLFTTTLMNLALNARDALPSGGTIRIATRRRSNAGRSLSTAAAITIADDGIGMDEETRRRAFEPFFTTKQIGRGNGLGLAMVYNFVTQAGGDISIASEPGVGTTVTMLLPMEEPAVRSVSPVEERLHILLVEDDPKIRKVVALHLNRDGYLVDEVASAEEALRLIDSGLEPSLILSDIRLRDGMSGVDLAMQLNERGAMGPFILMTGFAEELEQLSDAISAIPVLRKPFKRAELLAEIGRQIAIQKR